MKTIITVAVLLDGQIWSWKASENANARSLHRRYFPPGATAGEMLGIWSADEVKGVGIETVEGQVEIHDEEREDVRNWFTRWPMHPDADDCFNLY